jgi:hypothetical protein
MRCHQILLQTRETIVALMRKAMANGDLRPELDVEVAADIVLAPVFLRLLVGHQPMGKGFAEAIVELSMGGFANDRQ